jgi:hypothetical protein
MNKPCDKCGSTERYKNGRCVPCNRAACKRWYHNNKEKSAENARRYRKNNRERKRDYDLRWRIANREWSNAYAREYHIKNKAKKNASSQKWRDENPERHRKKVSQWQKNNPDRVCAKKQRRRARINHCDGNITADEWQQLKEHYEYRCLSCGRADIPLALDHIVPLVKGGSNTIDNAQPLCKSCNSRKSTKIIDYRPAGAGGQVERAEEA